MVQIDYYGMHWEYTEQCQCLNIQFIELINVTDMQDMFVSQLCLIYIYIFFFLKYSLQKKLNRNL